MPAVHLTTCLTAFDQERLIMFVKYCPALLLAASLAVPLHAEAKPVEAKPDETKPEKVLTGNHQIDRLSPKASLIDKELTVLSVYRSHLHQQQFEIRKELEQNPEIIAAMAACMAATKAYTQALQQDPEYADLAAKHEAITKEINSYYSGRNQRFKSGARPDDWRKRAESFRTKRQEQQELLRKMQEREQNVTDLDTQLQQRQKSVDAALATYRSIMAANPKLSEVSDKLSELDARMTTLRQQQSQQRRLNKKPRTPINKPATTPAPPGKPEPAGGNEF